MIRGREEEAGNPLRRGSGHRRVGRANVGRRQKAQPERIRTLA